MKYAAAETRRILRDRFTRYLPATQSGAAHPNNGDLLRDEVLLKLLLNLQPVLEGAADRARASYDAALAKNPGEPSFDQAIADGWFRIVWGRVAAPYEIDQRARAAPADTMTALNALLKKRFEETFVVCDAAKSDTELAELAGRIERGDTAPDALRSQDPAWVAARLWDRGLTDSASRAADLRTLGRSLAPCGMARIGGT